MKKILLTVVLLSTMPIISIANAKGVEKKEIMNNYNLSEMINYDETNFQKKKIFQTNEYEIILFAFSKKQGLKEHTTPFDVFLQIIEGEAVVTIDNKIFNLKKGDGITLSANIPHKVEAKTDFKMLLTKKASTL